MKQAHGFREATPGPPKDKQLHQSRPGHRGPAQPRVEAQMPKVLSISLKPGEGRDAGPEKKQAPRSI